MAITLDPGVYTCRLMKGDVGQPCLWLDEHHKWDAEKKDLGEATGGAQLLFAAEAFQKNEAGEFEQKGQIILDLFGYTLVASDDAPRNPGQIVDWKIDLLAQAFGVRPDEVFSLDTLPAQRLLDAWFDVEVEEWTSRAGRTSKTVARIGAVGALEKRGAAAPKAPGGANRALFAKFATHVRATHGVQQAPAAPTPAVPQTSTLPTRAAAPSAPPTRAAAPAAEMPPREPEWTATRLWEEWRERHGDNQAAYFEAIDKAVGRQGVEPSDLSPDEAKKVAHEMGLDIPF